MPPSGISPAWRRTPSLALAALVAAASRLAAADAGAPPLPAAMPGDELRDYARRLESEIERIVAERERALGDLEAERAAAKRALDRVLEQSVAREGALAEGLRRERALEAKLADAAADRERLLGEISAEADERTRAEIAAAIARAAMLDRLRTAELDRDEAIRLGEEAHRAAAGLAGEAETLRGRIRELEHGLALATVDSPAPPAASRAAELDAVRTEASSLRAELAAARRRLRALETTRDSLEKALADARGRRGTPPDASPAGGEADAEELGRQLAIERERRATLEAEMVRLSVSSDVAERYREAWEALQQARAEILLLSERLEREQATREELQVLLERARTAAEARGEEGEPLERLVEAAETHGRDTERLEADLRDANDRIARLRGHLETIEAPDGTSTTLAALEEENDRLRESLRAAEQRVGRLAGQAALARRLAEIVYAR